MDVSDLSMKASPVAVKVVGEVNVKKSVNKSDALPELQQATIQPAKAPESDTHSQPSTENLINLVDQANHAMQSRSSNLKFTMAEGTDTYVVRIEDSETGELIRQIPSEQMIAIAKALDELKQGTVLEEQA
jgi:flagellar protein FlaG